MAINIVTIEDLHQFKIELVEELKSIISNPAVQNKKYLKSPEVREMLGISAGTLQTLRITGALAYSKVGGTLFYENADVDRLLQKNKHVRK